MVTVSENTMNIAYSLNKEIKTEKIIKDIVKLCNGIPKHEIEHSVLVISIQKSSTYAGDSPVPKIEYKDNKKDSLT